RRVLASHLLEYAILALAGLHWANNVFILLRPGAPEQVSPLALVVYTDPVYSAGGSYQYDPQAYVGLLIGPVLLLILLFWRRSPFCLPKAPVPALDDSHEVPAVDNGLIAAPKIAQAS